MLWVSEYSKIYLGKNNRRLEDGDLELGEDDFNALLSLLEDPEHDALDLDPVFKYARPGGRPQLTVQNHVGVLRTITGTQIEILPKISRSMDVQQVRRLLINMLLELRDSPFREGTSADLSVYEMPLFELVMRHFLNHTTEIVRKGIARTYVERQDNIVFLRGKLQLTEQIRRNCARSDRFFCEFDEFEENRPINRLIKGALKIVAALSQDLENQQICRELLFWFDRVPATQSPSLDFQRMQRDRLIQHYEPAMPFCRLILERLSPLTGQGEQQVVSMLFPMEKVFEDFVAAKLKHQFRDWQIRTQVRERSLVENHLGRKRFNLRPDIELRRGGERIIADTKWKLLNQNRRDKNYGISQADCYQLFAYLKKYLPEQRPCEVILIYPANDEFTHPLAPFWYSGDEEVLYVLPFDLDAESLLTPPSIGLHVMGSAKAGSTSPSTIEALTPSAS